MSEPRRILVDSSLSNLRPHILSLSNGNVVAVCEAWTEPRIPGSGYDLIGRIFTSSGVSPNQEFRINEQREGNQWFADLCGISQGGIAIAWTSSIDSSSVEEVKFREFHQDGTPATSEYRVNQYSKGYAWLPKIMEVDSRNVVVGWSSWGEDGDREGIFYRIINLDGSPQTDDIRVNVWTRDYQTQPCFTIDPETHRMDCYWISYGQFGNRYTLMKSRVDLDFRK